MYNKIELKFKKNSAERKFAISYFLTALILYLTLIILRLFDFNKLFSSMLILLIILILIIYTDIFIKLGYKIKDWRLFFKFEENKKAFKQKNQIEERRIIQDIIKDLAIKRRNDIKLIIEHYRELSITNKKKYSYISFVCILIPILAEIKDIFDGSGVSLTSIITLLVVFFILFSILYFFFIEVIDLKDIISGDKNLYKNLEELFTEAYINWK